MADSFQKREAEPKSVPGTDSLILALDSSRLDSQKQHSWAPGHVKQVRDSEETYDYNEQMRGNDIYGKVKQEKIRGIAAPEDKYGNSDYRKPENNDYSEPRKDSREQTFARSALAPADKNFPSIDAAMKGRGDARDEKILPTELPNPLTDDMKRIPGVTPEVLDKVRREIRTNNLEPEEVVPALMRDVRVLGLGETHYPDNPQREFGTKMMPELAKNGATHLAIEVDSYKQPILDEFMKTGQLDIKELPPLLRDPEFMKMLSSARASGMKIVAVDDHSERSNRDEEMARNIENILEQNQKNKVVFWVGSAHLERVSDPDVNPNAKAASQILESKYKTATVVPNIGSIDGSSLPRATPDLTRPAMLPISRMQTTSELRTSGLVIPKCWYRDSDFVIVYPKKPPAK